MKIIYAKDINVIKKRFQLSEDELYYLKDLAQQINSEREDLCADLQSVLLYGSNNNDLRNAVSALLLYFGAKVQKDNDLRCAFDRTCWALANLLKCGSYQLMQWFRGLATIKNRFGSAVDCSDTFGLNYLEFSF